MKKTSIIAGIVVVAVIVIVAVMAMGNKKSDTTSPSANTSSAPSTAAAATITYSDSGFSPATVTVKSGDTVAIQNTSKENLQFDSDPHPVHTDNTDLNVGSVGSGESTTFTVTKKGSFGYHNHLDPSDKGKIVVE